MDSPSTHTTAQLVADIHAGDPRAREKLFARCLPLLQTWAHGRLPHYTRDLSDTNDLVQNTLVRALNRLDEFEPTHQGSFLAYLRTILINTIRDEVRRHGRRGPEQTLDDSQPGEAIPSPVEAAVGSEQLARYEAVLAELPANCREAIILRVEFGLSFPEIAAETGASPDAVRMTYNRAHAKLAELLEDGSETET